MINITRKASVIQIVEFCFVNQWKSKDFSPVKLMTNHLWNGRHFIYIEGGAPDWGRPCDQSITLNHSVYRQLFTYWLIDWLSLAPRGWVSDELLQVSTRIDTLHWTRISSTWWDAHTAFSRTDHHWTSPSNNSGRLYIIVMFALFAVSIIIVNVSVTVMCPIDGFRGRPSRSKIF